MKVLNSMLRCLVRIHWCGSVHFFKPDFLLFSVLLLLILTPLLHRFFIPIWPFLLTLALSNHLVMSLNLLQFPSETQTEYSEHSKHCSSNEWMIINDSTFLADKWLSFSFVFLNNKLAFLWHILVSIWIFHVTS